ncbi:MAG: CocE/NonD family hydrolase [Anaerolineae bacterium]|nr:CocE/NonD family hydrolase [Anaerolineae bacterium]
MTAAAGLWWKRRALVARALAIRPAGYHAVVERGLRIPMRDGVHLEGDRYSPRGDGPFPTLLIRTPYGRTWMPNLYARLFAQRGYHVLVQDVRGRFASEGEFDPFLHEASDGADTIAWLETQPWFDGRVGTWGQSYLGYVQWALAATYPDLVQAMMPVIASSRGPYTGSSNSDVPWLELSVRWMVVLEALDHLPGGHAALAPWYAVPRMLPLVQSRILKDAFQALPLSEADLYAVGAEVPHYRNAVNASLPPEFDEVDMYPQLHRVEAEAHLVGGWYDFMLPDLLADYAALRDAGRNPYLTIGPWTHLARGSGRASLREGLAWFDAVLKGRRERLRDDPVVLYLMQGDEWLTFERWPPPATVVRHYAGAAGTLSTAPPQEGQAPDQFYYDPADPTPAWAGARFYAPAGRRDNRPLEARPDVITYTSAPLAEDLDVVGPVSAELYASAGGGHADFFARLCDVTPDDLSYNVCDGIYRLAPGRGEPQGDGTFRIQVDMAGTAYRFRSGHRLRLQISGGAFPRYARNLGDQEIGAARPVLRPRVQTIYHDQAHPSAIHVPVRLADA